MNFNTLNLFGTNVCMFFGCEKTGVPGGSLSNCL